MADQEQNGRASLRQKLAESKARRAEKRALEAKLRSEGRLPPGQRITQNFPVNHLGRVPDVDLDSWTFKIVGAVKNQVQLTWAEFQELPRTSITFDIHCVSQWSKFDMSWEGVSIRTLIDTGLAEPLDTATHLIQLAEDGHRTNLPLEIALQENFVMATHLNGEVLELKHGYPLRGVTGHIPGRRDLQDVYLYKGAKWLRGVKFATSDEPGTWERAAYHNEGDIWREERSGIRIGK